MDIKELMSDELLKQFEDKLLEKHDQVTDSVTSDDDDNYTFGCCLYKQTLNAMRVCFRNDNLIEDHSTNNKLIFKVVDSPLYLRFLTTNPSEYRRRKGSNILELFSISDDTLSHPDLFMDNSKHEESLYGFFFYGKTSESIAYVRLQVFDKFWNLKVDWSSDIVQGGMTLEIDEMSVGLPEPKPLAGGENRLKPIKPIILDIKKGS